MRAIAFDRYGGPEVLHELEIPEPVAAAARMRARNRQRYEPRIACQAASFT